MWYLDEVFIFYVGVNDCYNLIFYICDLVWKVDLYGKFLWYFVSEWNGKLEFIIYYIIGNDEVLMLS